MKIEVSTADAILLSHALLHYCKPRTARRDPAVLDDMKRLQAFISEGIDLGLDAAFINPPKQLV